MSLTEAGAALLAPAEAMRDAAATFEVAAAGQSEDDVGTVRLTASVFMSHHVLPAILGECRREHPLIALELVATDAAENLLFREADIAIRMFKPTQLDVITRRIGEIPLGLFASTSYLDRAGRPRVAEDILEHDFVGYDRNEEIIRGFREAGLTVSRNFFQTRADHQSTYWELVRAGCGLGFAQRKTALADPQIEELTLSIDIPPLEVWLTAHESLRNTPRIRRVWDLLIDRLTAYCGAPDVA